MASHPDQEILDYLESKENLRLTLEIANFAARARAQMLESVLGNVRLAIERTCPDAGKLGQLSFVSEGKKEGYDEYLTAIPIAAAKQGQRLAFAVVREGQYELFVGLRWMQELDESDPFYLRPVVRELKSRLESNGFSFWPAWWLCGRKIHSFPSGDEFLCTLAEDPASILDPLTTAFWTLVEDTEEAVAKINMLVATR